MNCPVKLSCEKFKTNSCAGGKHYSDKTNITGDISFKNVQSRKILRGTCADCKINKELF